MARRKSQLVNPSEPESLKYFREWSIARDDSKAAAGELGEVVKGACAALDVTRWAFKNASELKRMDPLKAAGRLRDFNRLVREWNIDAQTDLEDAISAQDEVEQFEPVA